MLERLKLLEQTLHLEIPLTKTMGMRILDCTDSELRVHADLEPNINIHGTAFGGSLYSLCAAACWGLLHLKMQEVGSKADIVLGQGEINYLRPVREDILVCSHLPPGDVFSHFVERVSGEQKAALSLSAEVIASGRQAVHFTGHFFSTG